jgi:hypothetical protein
MVRGSCACGGIQIEADSIQLITMCHCSMCRKAHGSAFGTFAFVPRSEFRLLQGDELIESFESSPGILHDFCRVRGSNAPHTTQDGETWAVPAGLFDDDPGARPALHIFVGSKAPWWEIQDDLPKFEEGVPGYDPNQSG